MGLVSEDHMINVTIMITTNGLQVDNFSQFQCTHSIGYCYWSSMLCFLLC